MSWKDQIQNTVFEITTGDGRSFKPLWKPGESSKDYNTAAYEFINLKGTLVDRKQPKSNKYPLVFWFQGDNHLDEVAQFLNSADDPRAWEINHPYYGAITGQPLSIKRVDVNYGNTEISVDFWESIAVDFPDDELSVKDRIEASVLGVSVSGIVSFANHLPNTADINPIKESALQAESQLVALAGNDQVDFKNIVQVAFKATDALLKTPRDVIAAHHNIILAATRFKTKVVDRVLSFKNVFNGLVNIISSTNDKFFFESQGAVLVSGITNSAVNPIATDYESKNDIVEVISLLVDVYNDYIRTVDSLQVEQYDTDNAWSADAALQRNLNTLVIETVANLQKLSFDAKQERIIYTDKDTNLILLAHKYVGLDADDANIEIFRKNNGIKNRTLFNIPKGREIKYLV